MTAVEFRDRVIEEAIASVREHEKREHRKRGCLAGLEICRRLVTLDDYEKELDSRYETEKKMVSSRPITTPEEYWEYRCATAQIEFVLERMKVAYHVPGPVSAWAVEQYARIVGVNPDSDTTSVQ